MIPPLDPLSQSFKPQSGRTLERDNYVQGVVKKVRVFIPAERKQPRVVPS
jgi:hypothetical protein